MDLFLVSLVLWLWDNSLSKKNIPWVLILPVLAIGSELGQWVGLVSGTFDSIDLLLYILGLTLPFLFFAKITDHKILIV